MLDRDESSARETMQMIIDEGGEALAFKADVTAEAEVATAITTCVESWGSIDILHNNVGISVAGGDTSTTEITAEAFSRIMDINVRGMMLAAKYAVPFMREQRSGVIINIASTAVKLKFPTVAYKTSKAAVIALTEHLAMENAGYGIRVNAVLPGLMDTPMAVEHKITEAVPRDQIIAERMDKIPLKTRPGNAYDVANAAVFLASDKASYITGASLVVDGGHTLVVG